jgi:molecular chaperone GrpE (heat shock protein)
MTQEHAAAPEEDVAELTERWHRAAADMENTRKWADRQVAR